MYSDITQFGLFRYENGDRRKSIKQQRNFHSKVIICSIAAMSIIFCALLYVFVASRFFEPAKVTKSSNPKPKLPTENRGIEVVEISGKNISEEAPRRIKRLDSDESDRSPDSQKLIFFSNREFKPPKILEKPKVINFPQPPPNHRMTSRMAEPRPFRHMSVGPRPNGFQMAPKSTSRSFYNQVNNIHDVISQNQFPGHQHKQLQRNPMQSARFNAIESSSMHPIQLAGTYRHPRKNGELMKMFNQGEHQKYTTNQPEILPDPFHNFKPNSPFEINHMMNGMRTMTTPPPTNPYFRRKFKHQIASIPNYNLHSKDVAGIYQNVLHSGKKLQVDRNETPKNKPFSMMLDVYPYAGEDAEMSQVNHLQQMHQLQQMNQMQHMQQMPPRMPRLKPFQSYYQDPSYFNSMAYPQLMPRYPAYFRYQQPQPEASNINPVGMMKPSQLIVHLNLYPKNKVPFKRSSLEEQMEPKKPPPEMPKIEPTINSTVETSPLPLNINFNVNTGNGHPENIHHHVNLPRDPYHNYNVTTEPAYKPSYYYDENEDDQSLMVAPSLVYNTIHRDRPIHLMLRNTTTTEKPSKKMNNHKHSYQMIKRPRKQQIKSDPRTYEVFHQ